MTQAQSGKGAMRKGLGRFHDWWSYKVSYLLAPFYFLLVHFEGGLSGALATLAGLLGYFVATAAFGHVVNDLGDLEADARAEKGNSCAGRSKREIIFVLVGLAAASLACLFLAGASVAVFALAGLELLLFLAYSLKPLRWKESILGLVADSGYAHVVPFCIAVVVTSGQLNEPVRIGFHLFGLAILWQAFAGLRGIAGHELNDLPSDLSAGTRTAVVRMGADRAVILLRCWIVPVEIGVLLLLLTTMAPFLWLPVTGFAIYTGWFCWRFRPFHRAGERLSPMQSVDRWNHFLDLFYRQVLPLLVLAGAILAAPQFWPLLPVHLLLFHGARIWRRIPRSVIRKEIVAVEDGVEVLLEGCYLTSRLTTRTDVNIRLAVSIDGRELPGEKVDLHYGPNPCVDFYREKFGIEEPPVSFRIRAAVPRKNRDEQSETLFLEARWGSPEERVGLYRTKVSPFDARKEEA